MIRSRALRALTAVAASCTLHGPLWGGSVNFSSQNAAINVADGAQLVLQNGLSNVGGTINIAGSGKVLGAIDFNTGVLNAGYGQQGSAVITGTYDASGQTLTLADGLINADAYTILPNVVVSGTSRIEGQPYFTGSITLQDSSTVLHMGIQSVLQWGNIVLNGGTLVLAGDLALNNNVQIVGPGTVNCNNFIIRVGGPGGTWSSNLNFVNANIQLEQYLEVNGTWTLSGVLGGIAGNGVQLTLDSGSIIAKGLVVNLSNLEISGVRNGAGLVPYDQNSGFWIGDCNVWFTGDTTFSTGTIAIANPSTFFLAGHNVSFKNKASLVPGVNGAGLYVGDQLTVEATVTSQGLPSSAAGTLSAPVAFFSNGQFNPAAISQCVAAKVLYVQPIAGDSAALFTTINGSGSVAKQQLTGGALTAGQTVTSDVVSMTISHGSPITVGVKNVVFDGRGGSVYFAGQTGNLSALGASSPASPLFNVAAGASITLKNVRLQNVTQDTFNLAAASGSKAAGTVNFAENVTIDLGDNVILNQGNFNLVPSTSAGNGPTVLLVRGVNGRKQLTLKAISQTNHVLSLQNNSLMLQDVELIGTQYIGITLPTLTTPVAASVVLAGNARVNVGPHLGGVGIPIRMHFDVEDNGNELVFTEDGLTIAGTISFPGLAAENELEIDFLIPHALTAGRKVPATVQSAIPNAVAINVSGAGATIPDGVPYVVLTGNPGIALAGNLTAGSFAGLGIGRSVVVNALPGVFGVSSASFLDASGVEIVGNKIKETGSQSLFALVGSAPSFLAGAGSAVQPGAGIDSSGATKVIDRAVDGHQTAFSRLRDRQRARIEEIVAEPVMVEEVPVAQAQVSDPVAVLQPVQAAEVVTVVEPVVVPAPVPAPKLTQQSLAAAAQKMHDKKKKQVQGKRTKDAGDEGATVAALAAIAGNPALRHPAFLK